MVILNTLFNMNKLLNLLQLISNLRSLNSISVPNLVSIDQNFLEPEDPSQINFSGPDARSLHPPGTVTTKTYRLG